MTDSDYSDFDTTTVVSSMDSDEMSGHHPMKMSMMMMYFYTGLPMGDLLFHNLQPANYSSE